MANTCWRSAIPFFNLGPVDMPMSKGEVLMVLASHFQPNKFGNATEIVGALHQDRHSGIMGVLGAQPPKWFRSP